MGWAWQPPSEAERGRRRAHDETAWQQQKMAACSVGGWAGHSAAAPSGLNLPPAANLLTENARLHREREMVVTENQRLREEIDALSDALRRAVGPGTTAGGLR